MKYLKLANELYKLLYMYKNAKADGVLTENEVSVLLDVIVDVFKKNIIETYK